MSGERIIHRFDFVNVVIESQKSNKASGDPPLQPHTKQPFG